jgi:hypothetical protein
VDFLVLLRRGQRSVQRRRPFDIAGRKLRSVAGPLRIVIAKVDQRCALST